MKVAAAEDRVAKLKIAMAAMEGMEGPEVESVRAAHKRALEAVQGVPVNVQVKECKSFLVRTRSHFGRVGNETCHSVGEHRGFREAVVGIKGQVAETSPVGRVGGESVARLGVSVAGPSRIVAGPSLDIQSPNPKRPRHREDFTPHCDEEMQEWMECVDTRICKLQLRQDRSPKW